MQWDQCRRFYNFLMADNMKKIILSHRYAASPSPRTAPWGADFSVSKSQTSCFSRKQRQGWHIFSADGLVAWLETDLSQATRFTTLLSALLILHISKTNGFWTIPSQIRAVLRAPCHP